jgi:hypothetical protein
MLSALADGASGDQRQLVSGTRPRNSHIRRPADRNLRAERAGLVPSMPTTVSKVPRCPLAPPACQRQNGRIVYGTRCTVRAG